MIAGMDHATLQAGTEDVRAGEMSEGPSLEQLEALAARAGDPSPPLPASLEPLAGGSAIDAQLVFSFLVWEAGHAPALGAWDRLNGALVDLSELRVCLPSEIAAMLGPRYPRALERAERMSASLRGVFDRENRTSIASLLDMNKRDARAYLDSLEGMARFVASRVMLLALDAHAMPLDERLRSKLLRAGVEAEGEHADDAAHRLERRIRAGEARRLYLSIEAAPPELRLSRAGPAEGKPSEGHEA